jgi:hypothetical protein
MQIEQTWDLLQKALDTIEYKRDPLPAHARRFRLERKDADNYAVLHILTYNPNTYRPEDMRLTRHEFIVPAATYNERQWVRWVADRILSIEAHETMENFFVNGERVNAPRHGNGWDPYALWFENDPVERAKAPGDD